MAVLYLRHYGPPKGAMLTHGNLMFVALGMVAYLAHFEAEDVGLHAAPLTHATGFLALSMTMKGAAQVVLKPHPFQPEVFCATVAKRRVTATWLVPTQIKMLLLPRSGELGLLEPDPHRLWRRAHVCSGYAGGAASFRTVFVQL